MLRYGSAPIYELQDIRGSLNRGYAGSILSFKELRLSADLLRTSAAVKKYVENLPENEENILASYAEKLYSNLSLIHICTRPVGPGLTRSPLWTAATVT